MSRCQRAKLTKASEGVSGPPIRTSFAGQRKAVSSSVEEASTSGNNNGSGNVSLRQSILRVGDCIKGFFSKWSSNPMVMIADHSYTIDGCNPLSSTGMAIVLENKALIIRMLILTINVKGQEGLFCCYCCWMIRSLDIGNQKLILSNLFICSLLKISSNKFILSILCVEITIFNFRFIISGLMEYMN